MSNMVVRTNVFALNAHRNMKNVGMEQSRAANRLSSGFRINSAADDAAGLAISENMRAQIRGLDQASRNAQDGQAMLLTTEGGLEEIGNMLQRTRELLVQAANDTNTQSQRDMINMEINQLGQEVFSMQQRVEFNTNRVLAMGPALSTQVANNIAALQVDNMRVSEAFSRLDDGRALANEALEMLATLDGTATFNDLNARQQALINNALGTIHMGDSIGVCVAPAIDGGVHALAANGNAQFSVTGGTLGGTGTTAQITVTGTVGGVAVTTSTIDGVTTQTTALLTTIQGTLNNRITLLENRTSAFNQIRTAMVTNAENVFGQVEDFRDATTSGNNVAWFQVGANSAQGIQFDFEDVSRAVTSASAIVQTVTAVVANPDSGGGIGRGIEITPLVNQLQTSIDDISSVRANLGSVQNRLDYTMRSLDISSENLQDSESRVRNADIAREMMRFTMSNVLQSAAMSMLSQANQLPNNLLQLLR